MISVGRAEPAEVYCLTVPGVEHFCLASGAVVHNCADTARYAVMSTRPKLPKSKREEKKSKLERSLSSTLSDVEDAAW